MQWIRRLMRRLRAVPPLAVDGTLAVLATGTTLEVAHGSYPAGPRPFDALAVLLTLAANAPIALRRRAPRTVLLACTAALVVFEARGYWLALNQLGAEIAFFTVATMRSRRWIGLGAALVYPAVSYGNLHTWNGSKADVLLLSAAWFVALGAFGNATRRLAEHTRWSSRTPSSSAARCANVRSAPRCTSASGSRASSTTSSPTTCR